MSTPSIFTVIFWQHFVCCLKGMLDLAKHIVTQHEADFEPEKFEDHYEDALKDLLKKKQEGQPIEKPARHVPDNVREPDGSSEGQPK